MVNKVILSFPGKPIILHLEIKIGIFKSHLKINCKKLKLYEYYKQFLFLKNVRKKFDFDIKKFPIKLLYIIDFFSLKTQLARNYLFTFIHRILKKKKLSHKKAKQYQIL